jgi:CRP/FNR family transcriptional regulator
MLNLVRYSVVTHPAPVIPPASNTALCDPSAEMWSVSMPLGLTVLDSARLDSIRSSTRMIKNGNSLYRENDPFRNIYTILAGSFKTIVRHPDGRNHVTGFQLAGDMLGLDGVYTSHHSWEAIAIEDSRVCIIPFYLLELLCSEVKAIQQYVHRMMSSEIVRQSAVMMLLGTMSADQRLAAFLLNMSDCLKTRGYSPVEFNLRMTRDEIGSYLGMKLETVSRMFSKFLLDGLVDTHGKTIRILDLDGLSRV